MSSPMPNVYNQVTYILQIIENRTPCNKCYILECTIHNTMKLFPGTRSYLTVKKL